MTASQEAYLKILKIHTFSGLTSILEVSSQALLEDGLLIAFIIFRAVAALCAAEKVQKIEKIKVKNIRSQIFTILC